jgi:branched-chain amino acid transport system permease protein
MIFGAFLICRFFLKSRIGYLALAVKEDEMTASSLGINVFRIKVFVMALSAAMAGFGGAIFAFYQNSLFPEQTFSMLKSIELTMGTIIGGLGTLIGPIIGSFLLIPLGELLSYIFNDNLPGIKQLFYGITILTITLFQPKGIWPSIKTFIMRKK